MTRPSTKQRSVIALQIRNAQMKAIQIDAVAAHLAELMAGLHGMKWVIDVSHDDGCEFILIRRKLEAGGAK